MCADFSGKMGGELHSPCVFFIFNHHYKCFVRNQKLMTRFSKKLKKKHKIKEVTEYIIK